MYFKVKIGFGADDFISITPDELPRALKAQASGQVALFKEGSVAGNQIISVLPDWNRVMGYHRDYKLTGEDYEHIGGERVEEARNLLENAKLTLSGASSDRIEGPAQKMIGDITKSLTRGKK